ncbi:T-complex protein 10 C-terminus-domain-containing protein [Cladochytrium replicatum]|nr:T-complex protein 10 C-terminus-domain-containing protein [Cladochytrium replicatum]
MATLCLSEWESGANEAWRHVEEAQRLAADEFEMLEEMVEKMMAVQESGVDASGDCGLESWCEVAEALRSESKNVDTAKEVESELFERSLDAFVEGTGAEASQEHDDYISDFVSRVFGLRKRLNGETEETEESPTPPTQTFKKSSVPESQPEHTKLSPPIRNVEIPSLSPERRAKEEIQKERDKLDDEKKRFEEYTKEQTRNIEQYRYEQERALRKERLLWEKQRRAAEILPSKRERLEIELKNKQMDELTAQFKQKEARYGSTIERLRVTNTELKRRNAELEEEIRILERERATFTTRVPTETSFSELRLKDKIDPGIQQDRPLISGLSEVSDSSTTTKPARRKRPTSSTLSQFDSLLFMPNAPAQMNKEVYRPLSKKHNSMVSDTTDDDGMRTIVYVEGVVKQQLQDGRCIVRYPNGDKKLIIPGQLVEFWYANINTLQRAYEGGVKEFIFDNGQRERRYPSGRVEIFYPDGKQRVINHDPRVDDHK